MHVWSGIPERSERKAAEAPSPARGCALLFLRVAISRVFRLSAIRAACGGRPPCLPSPQGRPGGLPPHSTSTFGGDRVFLSQAARGAEQDLKPPPVSRAGAEEAWALGACPTPRGACPPTGGAVILSAYERR